MIEALVLFTQFGLLALVLLMGFRMLALVKAAPLASFRSDTMELPGLHRRNAEASANPPALPDRPELITQLHILAGLQERDCRVRGLRLADSPLAVRAFATSWLYGAACALSEKPVRHSETLACLVAEICSRKTAIGHPQAMQAIATLTHSSISLACYREGLEGAEFWRHHHYVAPQHSLYEAVTANSFI